MLTSLSSTLKRSSPKTKSSVNEKEVNAIEYRSVDTIRSNGLPEKIISTSDQ